MKIKNISNEEAEKIIKERKPLGKFIFVEKETIVAIDNEDGEVWTEDFKENHRKLAEDWLNGKIDIKDYEDYKNQKEEV